MDGGALTPKSAILYRMVTPEHVCPFGLKSLDLLKREGVCGRGSAAEIPGGDRCLHGAPWGEDHAADLHRGRAGRGL